MVIMLPPRQTKSKEKSRTRKEEDDTIKVLTSLSGVGKATAQKLIECGYTSLELIAITPPKTLEEEAHISSTLATKIVEAARQKIGLGFILSLIHI